MLTSLSIRNVVLIDKLDLDFPAGFSVLSGETGAGKSILLDSVGLLLGHRAETSMIRGGCDRLSVSGCFEITRKNEALERIFREQELDFSGEIMIKRTLDKDGRGKIFVNDQQVTLKLLKDIGANLVEIHGQFDNQGLLNPATHLEVLDNYGSYHASLFQMKTAYAAYKRARQEREEAEKNLAAAAAEEDNLRHWVEEFQKIKPEKNEMLVLEDRRQQMMYAEKIAENLDGAYKALNQPNSVRAALRQAQTAIARINGMLNNKFAGLYETLDTALVNVEEANEEIEAASSEVNFSQEDINQVEERLYALKDLARKHGAAVEELPQVWAEMTDKLTHLEHGGENLKELRELERKAHDEYMTRAEEVSRKRRETAEILDAKIQAELPDLKMEKARFKTQITEKPENLRNESGMDDVCFLVSTNPSTPYGLISKIASGGELARFMLALKVNLAKTSAVETMIFDEIDTGIGGATARAVGEKLAKLGESVQVLVVTHSPQIAALSRCHYKVEKNTEDNVTTTSLQKLSPEQKTEEIARMLSGEHITDEARAAAKVLIGA